jgi:hypothetical protein
MKIKAFFLVLVLAAALGCSKNAVVANVPGSINSFDSESYVTLMDVQGALKAVKDDVATGRYTPTPAAKAVINQAIRDYDLGQDAWHAYHSGISQDQVGLQNAINQIIFDIVQIADPQVPAPKKLQGAK